MPRSNTAVFFDRDNTLIVTDGYLGDPAAVVLLDGAAEAVARARRLGYSTVVFSNQSGVARGLFDEEAVRAVNAQMEEHLRMSDPEALIDKHEFCPFHPNAPVERYRLETPMRKPAPGMLYHAADELGIDLTKSWVVGDAPRDIEAGRAAGCRTIWLRHDLPPSAAARANLAQPADFEVKSLTEALDVIERNPAPSELDSLPGDEASASEPAPAGNGAARHVEAPIVESAELPAVLAAKPTNVSATEETPAAFDQNGGLSDASSPVPEAIPPAVVPDPPAETGIDSPLQAAATADQPSSEAMMGQDTASSAPGEWASPTSAATTESERTAEWVFVAESGSETGSEVLPAAPAATGSDDDSDSESPAWPAETPAASDEAMDPDDTAPVGLTFSSQEEPTAIEAEPSRVEPIDVTSVTPAAEASNPGVEPGPRQMHMPSSSADSAETSRTAYVPASAEREAPSESPAAPAEAGPPSGHEQPSAPPVMDKPVPMVSEATRLAMRQAAAAKKAARRAAMEQPSGTTPKPAGVEEKSDTSPAVKAERQTEPTGTSRFDTLAEQILQELRRRHEQPATDFSITKLLAGVVQIMVLPALFSAYLGWGTPVAEPRLLLALVLQTMTIALLIMSRL